MNGRQEQEAGKMRAAYTPHQRTAGAKRKTATLTTNEVAKLSGATLRQLQWWDEQRLICPTHNGHDRVYSQTEAASAVQLTKLREAGVSLQQCRDLLSLHSDIVEQIIKARALLKRYKIKVG